MPSLVQSVAPLLEPISLPEAKAHLRVGINDDDQLIESCIRTARWNLERTYRFACLTQTLVQGMDWFGQAEYLWDMWWPVGWWPPQAYGYPLTSVLELRPPVQSVTSVTYTDTAGNPQTLAPAGYLVDGSSWPARILPARNTTWPASAQVPNAVVITYVAGYTDPTLVPDDIRQSLKLIIGDLYENREQSLVGSRLAVVELPRGVDDLMAPYKFPLVR